MVIYSKKVQLNISLLFLDIKNLLYFLLLHVAVLFNVIRNTCTLCMVYLNINVKKYIYYGKLKI